MSEQGIKIMEILLQSGLTVIGWILAAVWAVRQINITHKKNLELQENLLDEDYKRKVGGGIYLKFIQKYRTPWMF
jgi:hypothetical protein